MFGSRLKTWMENYIGRPRKKEVRKEKSKGSGGFILESSESLAYSDAGISSGSQQVLSSSTTDNKECYSTTTIDSEKSGMTHCRTAVSLPSPESAYSTGYSTDGASPGGTGPPEYYINIRTGKHYFPSPAPTPTSPPPVATFSQPPAVYVPLRGSLLPGDLPRPPGLAPQSPRARTFAAFPETLGPPLSAFPAKLHVTPNPQNTLSTSVPSYFEIFNFSKSPLKKSFPKSQLTPIKLFLKSPKIEKEKPKVELEKTATLERKKKLGSGGKPKRWFKQPFQKLGHRRTDPCDEEAARGEQKREIHSEGLRYFLGQEISASPRQRNRIKTNPWLPTEPLSSQNFRHLHIGFSPSLVRNRSCGNTPLQIRKCDQADPMQGGGKQTKDRWEGWKERGGSRHAAGKAGVESSEHSEEDLTLNEVMGTYNESYVYEKETDILSDSDPTDCEDYGTDTEAENGGDERDSHDDELDFIDGGSVTETDDDFPQNTGKCSYHDIHIKKNSLTYKSDRRICRRDSELRKTSRKEHDQKGRREKRRPTRKSFKREEEERKKSFKENGRGIEQKVEIDENVGGLNLSRVLVQRMMAKNAGKSAEGSYRLRESSRENSEEGKSVISRESILVDLETDNKYNQLMKEAENMIESLQNSPVVAKRKELVGSRREEEQPKVSTKVNQQTKTAIRPREGAKDQEPPPRKSPKNLGLNFSVETPKKAKRLGLEGKEGSFRTRSSAHSPLDPLGPALRNFAVFRPAAADGRRFSESSSEDSEETCQVKPRIGGGGVVPGSPVVPISFQSVDLGKALASYCPQSEPVKRKIYSCSKTYDKLVKRFENESAILNEGKPETGTFEAKKRGNQGLLPDAALPSAPARSPPLQPLPHAFPDEHFRRKFCLRPFFL